MTDRFLRTAGTLALAGLLAGCASDPTDPGGSQPPPEPVEPDVVVTVRTGTTFQAIEGFGATHSALVYAGGSQDNVPPALRTRAIQAAYGDVGLNMGNVQVGNLEPANDNGDPFSIDWGSIVTWQSEVTRQKLVEPARPLGFDNPYPGVAINVRWGMRWMKTLRGNDYQRYLQECAEFVLAGVLDWKNRYGSAPRFAMIHNEPLRGARLLDGGTTAEVVDIVRVAGQRLEDEGLGSVKFVVPGEETEEMSLSIARAVMADPEARRFVGAIAYHGYPYGSTYASVPNILASSGRGAPVASEIQVRRELRDLGQAHGVPIWMTEISNGEVDPRSMDHVRGRAIHIHDEFTYANASAFFGMQAFWDSQSHFEHFGNRRIEDEMDTIVLIDNDAGEVLITGMGYAIGHYARWLERGARRVETSSNDALLLATAYRDDARRTFTAVLINNADTPRVVRLDVQGLDLQGEVTGEVSAGDDRWKPLTRFVPAAPGRITVTVPAEGVLTLQRRF